MANDQNADGQSKPDPNERDAIAYAHTALCQVCLPYRDPGDDVRVWVRTNGRASLRITAGAAFHEHRGWREVGLPYGPKPRLILAYLNTRALRTRSPVIDVEATLTGFLRRLGLDDGGRTAAMVRDQLPRLALAELRVGVPTAGMSKTLIGSVVEEFDLWAPNGDPGPLWPASVCLSHAYFGSLVQHAVPLDERALVALSHSSLTLDVYAWLAQRLLRVPAGPGVLVTWPALHRQFGLGYVRVRKFREGFKAALGQVIAAYPAARVELDDRGLTLRESAPPVARRLVQVGGLTAG